MGTGLIYAAIVAAWAAYLVPLWLRRQDELAASRQEGRAIGARILERRTPTEVRNGQDLQPRGEVIHDSGEDVEDTVTGPVAGQARSHGRAAAARRRRTLFVLLLTTTLVAALAAAAVVSWWWIAVPGGCILAFLVASAVAVRRAHRTSSDSVPEEWTAGHGRADGADADADEELSGQDDAAASDGESVGESVAAGAERDHDNGDSWRGADGLWDPIPVPLPTYVTKAKAPRTVRTIELADSDVQSSGRLPEAEMLDRPADSPDDVVEAHESAVETDPDGGEPAAEHRHAVGD